MGAAQGKLQKRRELKPYTKSTGLYPSCDWNDKKVKKMIYKEMIAPRIPGSETRKESSVECPICFMYYAPAAMNKTKCCSSQMCTECYLQIQSPQGSNCCSFCNSESFSIEHEKTEITSKKLKKIQVRTSAKQELLLSHENVLSSPTNASAPQFATVKERCEREAELENRQTETFVSDSVTSNATTAPDAAILESVMIQEAMRRSMKSDSSTVCDSQAETSASFASSAMPEAESVEKKSQLDGLKSSNEAICA